MQAIQGDKILIQGKNISLSLSKKPNQEMTVGAIANYESFIKSIDDFFEYMKEHHDINLTDKNKPHKKIIRLFDRLHSESSENRSIEANAIIARMECIKLYFDNLKINKPEAHKSIRKNIIKNSSSLSYYGFIFELIIADILTTRKINFTITDTSSGKPDFQINTNKGNYFIECRSIFSTERCISDEKYSEKITHGIRDKEKKPYASKNCALFIDTTPIESLRDNRLPQGNSELLPTYSKFGCVAFFSSYTRTENGKTIVTYAWERAYFDTLDQEFKAILESIIPYDSIKTTHMIDTFLDI